MTLHSAVPVVKSHEAGRSLLIKPSRGFTQYSKLDKGDLLGLVAQL